MPRPDASELWMHAADLDASGNSPLGTTSGKYGKPGFRCKHCLNRGIMKEWVYSGNLGFCWHFTKRHQIAVAAAAEAFQQRDMTNNQVIIDMVTWTTTTVMWWKTQVRFFFWYVYINWFTAYNYPDQFRRERRRRRWGGGLVQPLRAWIYNYNRETREDTVVYMTGKRGSSIIEFYAWDWNPFLFISMLNWHTNCVSIEHHEINQHKLRKEPHTCLTEPRFDYLTTN